MGVDGEKERISAEITRSGAVSPSEPILPVVNPAAVSEKRPDPPASNIHPAFYVTTWIALSSSIIIFNKWILDDGGFRTCLRSYGGSIVWLIMRYRLPGYPNLLASVLRYRNDPDHVKNNNASRRTQDSQDDWQDLLACNCSHRGFLQLVLDMRQHHVSIPWCCIHTNAEG